MKRIYLDYASTTKVDEVVRKNMIEAMETFGNPSAMYREGRDATDFMFKGKQEIANILNCNPGEIIFTGSGTESDNLAIFGYLDKFKNQNKHIITTKMEHHAVLHPFQKLEQEGFEVTYLSIDKNNGIIDLEELENSIKDNTVFISIMYANNEIGTIQPIIEIAKILNNKQIVFHIDACQAVNYLDINVKNLGIDMMTFSGSKIYGPKGIGVLYKKTSIEIDPMVLGGGQEMNLRSGTESVMMISGIVEALKLVEEKKITEVERLTKLKDYFIHELQSKITNLHINGDLKKRLPNNIHLSIEGVEGEALVLMLDEYGISAATGSACSSLDLDISHVLSALNIPIEYSHGSLRFTLGRETTKKELDYTVESMVKITERLRSFSSIRLNTKKNND